MHYYELDEDEARFEAELERLENQPSYMSVSLDEYFSKKKQKEIDTKRLWLKFTLDGGPVPEVVTENMVAIILKQVQVHDTNHAVDLSRLDEKEHNRMFRQEMIYELLRLLETDADTFWDMLHKPNGRSLLLANCCDNEIIEKLRAWLPERRFLNKGQRYAVFEALDKKTGFPEHFEERQPYGEDYRKRYKRWVAKKRKIMKYFEKEFS